MSMLRTSARDPHPSYPLVACQGDGCRGKSLVVAGSLCLACRRVQKLAEAKQAKLSTRDKPQTAA